MYKRQLRKSGIVRDVEKESLFSWNVTSARGEPIIRLSLIHIYLTRFALRMVEQGCFFGYFSHGRIVKLVIIWLQDVYKRQV